MITIQFGDSRPAGGARRTLGACLLGVGALMPVAGIAAQHPRAEGVWNAGAADEPVLRVRQYAAGFWIIQQGKRSNAEAPFMYRIAGRGDVDQVVQLCAPARAGRDGQRVIINSGATVRSGTRTPLGRVRRVVYTERGDLTH